MSKLELRAKIEPSLRSDRNDSVRIQVYEYMQDGDRRLGRKSGELFVQREHAAEVLGIINAGADAVEACWKIIAHCPACYGSEYNKDEKQAWDCIEAPSPPCSFCSPARAALAKYEAAKAEVPA